VIRDGVIHGGPAYGREERMPAIPLRVDWEAEQVRGAARRARALPPPEGANSPALRHRRPRTDDRQAVAPAGLYPPQPAPAAPRPGSQGHHDIQKKFAARRCPGHAGASRRDHLRRRPRRARRRAVRPGRLAYHREPALAAKPYPAVAAPRSPELNRSENFWQSRRQAFVSQRVNETAAAILDAACQAWNDVLDTP
jgi:hypothetical protein